jgi:hypothetical protein
VTLQTRLYQIGIIALTIRHYRANERKGTYNSNSTTQAAEASIAYHKLDLNVKAYGSPWDLAKDLNVDLVVVSLNIMKHFELARPVFLQVKTFLWNGQSLPLWQRHQS